MELLRRLEDRARQVLPEAVFDYYAGAAGDEVTLAENEEAWRRLWLAPRQLRGVAGADLAVELLGAPLAAPIGLAPAASLRLLHPEGELAVARAAAQAGLLSCLSTRATADLAEVAAAAPEAPRWFQLYVSDDRELARGSSPAPPRTATARSSSPSTCPWPAGASGAAPRAALAARGRAAGHPPRRGPPGHEQAARGRLGGAVMGGPRVDREAAGGLPLLLKGIVTGEDAELAVQAGAAGVVVSNHGGRQLDGCVPTAVALPEVVEAVAGRAAVLVDGGIRSGADVARRSPSGGRRARRPAVPVGPGPRGPGRRRRGPRGARGRLGALPRPAGRAQSRGTRPAAPARPPVVSPLGAGKIDPSRRGTRPLAGTSAQSARFAKSPRPDSCV
jgi:4-hydroxymandelate oxidase